MPRTPLHDRVFRAFLRLFPSDFRGDFGEQMAEDFRDQRRDTDGRPRELQKLWLRTVVDLLRRAPREHIDVLWRDVVYALRISRRHPAASATVVASLAIGIGLNSAVYSVVNGVLWRSLPFANSDRLVAIGAVVPSVPEPQQIPSAVFADLQQTRSLDAVAAAGLDVITIVDPGEPAQVGCAFVTERFFEVLGAKPVLGRSFTPADYEAAAALRLIEDGPPPTPPAVVLSQRLWRTRFGSDLNVIGNEMKLADGGRITIVGVMGPELDPIGRAIPGQCWFPAVPIAAARTALIAIGRLAPGRSVAEANAELEIIGGELAGGPFAKDERQTLRAVGLLERTVGRARTQLVFLFAAVMCVLLVTCANVVNLFLAHAAGRRDELSTRVALGASRSRLVRQSLTESLVIALLGGVVGFALAIWAVPVLVTLAPTEIPRVREVHVDWSTFGFTLGISTTVGVVCGLLACVPSRSTPRTMFGALATSTTRGSWLRPAVIVCEVGLALMLAVAASLMVRTVRALEAIDLGFDPTSVVSVSLSGYGWLRGMPDIAALQSTIVERVKSLPGVRAAGIGLGPLEGGMSLGGLVVPGDPRDFGLVRVDAVSPGYFEALGARLLAGRFFESRDAIPEGRDVILVNQTAARIFWNGSNPIGKTVVVFKTHQLQVIGVVADFRGSTLEEEQGPTIYQLSNQSRNFLAGTMLIRVDGDVAALVPAIRAVIRSINPEQPFSGVRPLQERINRSMAPRLFMLRLIGLFSMLGLVLAIVGVYGVLAEFVVQRVPEIGVRMAVGATAADVLALVLGHGARLVALGVTLGLAGAVLLRGAMTTFIYGVQPFDPLAYATACLLLLATTMAACTVPARRASRLDPVVALRTE